MAFPLSATQFTSLQITTLVMTEELGKCLWGWLYKCSISVSICMFSTEPTCWTVGFFLNPELSEKYSVALQLVAHVDHLVEETHQANYTYHGHKLHFLIVFSTLCIICTIEHWSRRGTYWSEKSPFSKLHFLSAHAPGVLLYMDCSVLLSCLHTFTVHAVSVCVPS